MAFSPFSDGNYTVFFVYQQLLCHKRVFLGYVCSYLILKQDIKIYTPHQVTKNVTSNAPFMLPKAFPENITYENPLGQGNL
jgi:hypothetical protein